MMSGFINELCNPKCQFVKCVDNLNNVITKATLHQVKQYVHESCQSALHRYDSFGRLPMHVAASCGKANILSWLISVTCQNIKGFNKLSVDAVDKESGWSALHRAIYYGRIQCAMLLLNNGADMWLRDKDGCNVFDFIIKDVSPWFTEPVHQRNSNSVVKTWTDLQIGGPNEVYTWGLNENKTIGQPATKNKSIPEPVRFFAKEKLSIKQVVLCKYHSIFVTHNGQAYTCGSGTDGQLGCGKRNVSSSLNLVELEGKVRCVAASSYHSIFVLANGQVWTCGRNHHHVLGINPPPLNSLQPAYVSLLEGHHIIGCAAGQYHTVAWSRNSLFTFGTNAGQLGHSKGDIFVDCPRKVSAFYGENKQFVDIHACDSATVVASTQGIIFLFYNFVCCKILSRHTDVIKVQVGGGMLDEDVIFKVQSMDKVKPFVKKESIEKKDLKVLILKNSGDVLSWKSSRESADHSHFNTKQLRWVRDIVISANGSTTIFTSVDGTAYFARYSSWYPGKKKSALHKQEYFSSLELIECDPVQMFKLEQIPCAFRTHTAALGPKGSNAALLQCNPCNFLTEVPLVGPPNLNDDLSNFLGNTSDSDLLHDIILRIKRLTMPDADFAAHLFVLSSRSRFLARMIASRYDKKAKPDSKNPSVLIVENVHPDIFKDCLQFLYSGRLPISSFESQFVRQEFVNLGSPIFYWEGSNRPKKSQSQTKQKGKIKPQINRQMLLQNLISVLDVQNIAYPLDTESKAESSDSDTDRPHSVSLQHVGFSVSSLPYLYDCIVMCSNGVKYSAHKCILAARIPYFSGMLFSPWINQEDEMPLLKIPLPSDIFQCVMEFAYSDSSSCRNHDKTVENRCEVLAAADLLLMDRLKQIAESQIAPMLTLKKVSSIVDVSIAFNAKQLYDSCLQFMCHHLNALLTVPAFYSVDDETLEKLENRYRSYLPQAYMRAMPACSGGPIIDHIPEHDDNWTDGQLTNTKRRFDVKITPKRTKNEQNSQTAKRKLSETTSIGLLLSDLLKSREETIVMNVKKRHQRNSETVIEEEVKHDEVFKESKSKKRFQRRSETVEDFDNQKRNIMKDQKMEIVKRKSKNKPRTSSGPQTHTSNPESPTQNVTEIPKKEANPKLVQLDPKPKAISKAQSYANYEVLFPQLGATPSKTTVSKASNPTSVNPPTLSEQFSSPAGLEIIKVKKKGSKKDRRKSKDKPTPEKSKPIDIQPAKTNVWGVPLKSPEEYVNKTSSLLSPERPSPVFPTTVFAKPMSPPAREGAWQNPPLPSYGSPPSLQGLHRSESVTSTDSKPAMFVDILQDEIRNIEIAEKISKKSMASIQLEETAMNELKLHYQSTNRSKTTFFTVSRLDHVTAKEIEDLRRSANQK